MPKRKDNNSHFPTHRDWVYVLRGEHFALLDSLLEDAMKTFSSEITSDKLCAKTVTWAFLKLLQLPAGNDAGFEKIMESVENGDALLDSLSEESVQEMKDKLEQVRCTVALTQSCPEDLSDDQFGKLCRILVIAIKALNFDDNEDDEVIINDDDYHDIDIKKDKVCFVDRDGCEWRPDVNWCKSREFHLSGDYERSRFSPRRRVYYSDLLFQNAGRRTWSGTLERSPTLAIFYQGSQHLNDLHYRIRGPVTGRNSPYAERRNGRCILF